MDRDQKSLPFRMSDAVSQEAVLDRVRRRCGCPRTSDKVLQILAAFPQPQPPPPTPSLHSNFVSSISAYCARPTKVVEFKSNANSVMTNVSEPPRKLSVLRWSSRGSGVRVWRTFGELLQLLQLSLAGSALLLYYLLYCYMQLVYYTLRSAIFFHNADGPMKITLGIVTITSLIVGFNLLIRLQKVATWF